MPIFPQPFNAFAHALLQRMRCITQLTFGLFNGNRPRIFGFLEQFPRQQGLFAIGLCHNRHYSFRQTQPPQWKRNSPCFFPCDHKNRIQKFVHGGIFSAENLLFAGFAVAESLAGYPILGSPTQSASLIKIQTKDDNCHSRRGLLEIILIQQLRSVCFTSICVVDRFYRSSFHLDGFIPQKFMV